MKFGICDAEGYGSSIEAESLRIAKDTAEMLLIDKSGKVLAVYPANYSYWGLTAGIHEFSTLEQALAKPPKAEKTDYKGKGGKKP